MTRSEHQGLGAWCTHAVMLCRSCESVSSPSSLLQNQCFPSSFPMPSLKSRQISRAYVTRRHSVAASDVTIATASLLPPPPSSLILQHPFLLTDTTAVGSSSLFASSIIPTTTTTSTGNKYGAHSFPNPQSCHTPVLFLHHLQLQSHRHARASDIRR